MFFSLLPNTKYKNQNSKEYIAVKNIFASYKLNEDLARNEIIFTKYVIKPNTTIQDISEEYYGDSFYDWTIILINNLMNPTFAIPLTNDQIIEKIKKDGNIPNDVAYTIDKKGVRHDKRAHTKMYNINNNNIIEKVNGKDLYFPVTYLEHENKLNEENSTIYLLKPRYVRSFIDDFKKEMTKYQTT